MSRFKVKEIEFTEGRGVMEKKRLAIIAAVIIGSLLAVGIVSAATQQDVTVQATVQQTLELTATPSSIDYGNVAPNGGPASDGVYETENVTATVKSSVNWQLKLTKNQDLTSGTNTIPSARFTYGVDGDPKTNQLAVSPGAQVKTGTPTSSQDVVTEYKLDIDWVDATGTYTATHTYDLSAL